MTAATNDYDAAIKADFSNLSEAEDVVIHKFAHFKRVLLGAPIQMYAPHPPVPARARRPQPVPRRPPAPSGTCERGRTPAPP